MEHHMRHRFASFVTVVLLLTAPANAAVTPEIDPAASLGVVQQWIYNYRARPDYGHVPAAARSDRIRPRPNSSSPASFRSLRKTSG